MALFDHLEEEQKGELLDVVLIRQAVIAEDVAVVPELLDDGIRGHWFPLTTIAGAAFGAIFVHISTKNGQKGSVFEG